MSALKLTERDEPPPFDNGLQCRLRRLEYDPVKRIGALWLGDGDCTDMSGAIAVFVAIDPEVQAIVTWSGRDKDTAYHRRGDGTWHAVVGNFHAS